MEKTPIVEKMKPVIQSLDAEWGESEKTGGVNHLNRART
jgi:hypothetical protein